MNLLKIVSKNHLLFPVLTGVLVLIISFGVTTAYFLTSNNSMINNFIIGENRIVIHETFDPPSPFEPGVTFEKNATVQNTGNLPCFVRIRIEFSNKEAENWLEELVPNTAEGWTAGNDGWFYYTEPLRPLEITPPFLDAVYGGVEMKIDEYAEDLEPFDLTFYTESTGAADVEIDFLTAWDITP